MSVFKKSALLVGLILGLLWANSNIALCQGTGSGPYEVEMVFVAGGTFDMGCTYEQTSDCAYDEKPAHPVTLRGFAIAKYEVTQKLWREVMGSNPSRYTGDDLPVQNVSWDDVQIFIQRLNQKTGMKYRLPTEAEWEYAARGGALQGDIPFLYSGGSDMDAIGWYNENSESQPHAIGTKAPNALGIYDMSGNVWEWCYDLYEMYSEKAQTNPKGASKGVARVTRGGCYVGLAKQCRVTCRKSLYQGTKDAFTGFRLAMDDDREAQAAEAARQAEQERLAAEKAAADAARQAEQERLSAEKAAADAAKKAEQERLAAEKAAADAARKAEQERLAAEKAAADAAKKAEQERLAAEKAAADAARKAEQERLAAERKAQSQERLAALPPSVFFTLNTAYTSMPQWSYGFKIGTVRVVGWYFSAMTNFNYKGAFSDFELNQHYELTGNSKTSYLEGQLGLVVRPCKPLSIHIGAGFGYRSLNFESDQGWHSYKQRIYYGPTATFGFMFHIKGFVLSAEATGMAYNMATYNNIRYAIGARVGAGFCLPYKKNDTRSSKSRKD